MFTDHAMPQTRSTILGMMPCWFGVVRTRRIVSPGEWCNDGCVGEPQGVSVNSGSSVEPAAQGIPNKQIGVSTVGEVRNAGGTVVRARTPGNPGHCLIGGLSAEAMSGLLASYPSNQLILPALQ
jgi:hypothetical protein